MLIVGFKNLNLSCYLGLYNEEKKIASQFKVSVSVAMNPPSNLYYSIDYTKLIEITRAVFKIYEFELMESVLMKIKHDIYEQYPYILGLKIFIRKKRPMSLSDTHATFVKWKEGYFE